MSHRELLLKQIDAFENAYERARKANAVAVDRAATGKAGSSRPTRRTIASLGLFAMLAVGGTTLVATRPAFVAGVARYASGYEPLEVRRIGSTIYPVNRAIPTDDGAIGVGAPGVFVSADESLTRWTPALVRTSLEVDPRAVADLGPGYAPETIGRVGDILTAVGVADGRVVAVGGFLGEGGTTDSSTLVRDRGTALWRRPVTMEAGFLHAVAFSGRTGYAVGNFGQIISSDSAGEQWDFAPLVTNADLFDVAMVGPRGVVVGGIDDGADASGFGVILVSETWGSRFEGTLRVPHTLRALAFADERRGWAVGDGFGVYSTADGGRTWTEAMAARGHWGTEPDLVAVAAEASGDRVAVGFASRTGDVYFSADGTTWSTAALPADAGRPLAALVAHGALYVFTDSAWVYRAEARTASGAPA